MCECCFHRNTAIEAFTTWKLACFFEWQTSVTGATQLKAAMTEDVCSVCSPPRWKQTRSVSSSSYSAGLSLNSVTSGVAEKKAAFISKHQSLSVGLTQVWLEKKVFCWFSKKKDLRFQFIISCLFSNFSLHPPCFVCCVVVSMFVPSSTLLTVHLFPSSCSSVFPSSFFIKKVMWG